MSLFITFNSYYTFSSLKYKIEANLMKKVP